MTDDVDEFAIELTDFSLDADREQELLERQKECTFIWTNKAGEPVGVIMTYLAARGKIWLAVTEQRVRVAAVQRDPRTCVVVSSAGLDWGTGKTVTYKGTTVVHRHDSPAVAGWFFKDYVTKLHADNNAERIAMFTAMMDIPDRVVMEFTPTTTIGYDGDKMARTVPGSTGRFDDMWK